MIYKIYINYIFNFTLSVENPIYQELSVILLNMSNVEKLVIFFPYTNVNSLIF